MTKRVQQELTRNQQRIGMGNVVTTELLNGNQRPQGTPRDLRELLELLQTEERILHITREVLPEPDVQSFCRAASELVGGPPLLFNNIAGYKGKRLAINLLASWPNFALMCGLPANTSVAALAEELCNRANESLYKPTRMAGKAPSYECLKIENVDLYRTLPLFRVNGQDGGFYLHKACIVSQDMDRRARHDGTKLGMYPLQVQGRDRLGVHLKGTDNLAIHLKVAEKMNCPLLVAVCLGVPPLASLVASAASSYEKAEYSLISALSERAFELTQCVKSELLVPAYSEYVLEGYIEPTLRYPEGPFTCDGGGFSRIEKQPQIKVTAIAHRKEPILDNTYIGKSWTEHDSLIGMASVLRLHKQAKSTLPQLARSGTRADRIYLKLGYCSGRGDDEQNARKSSHGEFPLDRYLGKSLTVYKHEIELHQRRNVRCCGDK